MQGTNDTATIVRLAALHALGAVAYIMTVAFIVTSMPSIENQIPPFVAATLFLTLLVLSVASMGLIVFGRPVIWFLNGEKVGAIRLAIATVIALAAIAAIFLIFVTTIR